MPILIFIAALLLGVATGILTGLFPGIHINLVGALLLALLGFFLDLGVPVLALAIFVVSMSITHTFVDFIPSIFLGAPDEDTFLSVLPGHQLLRRGRGYEAVVLTLFGGLFALAIIVVFSFVFVYFLPALFELIKTAIPFILIFVSLYLIFREDEIVDPLIIFILAGFLGLFTFNLPVKEPLLPLLSGLFGVSGLIVSIRSGVKIPKQKIIKLRKIKLTKKEFLKSGGAAAVAAPLCSFLPGIGSGHAAVISSEIAEHNNRSFLFAVGAISTIVMGLSFVTAYAIGKTRTGSAAVVKEILGEINSGNLIVIILAACVAGLIAFFIGIYLAKFFARNISKFNYSKISLVIILILFTVNLFLSNWIGLVVLITGSALGVFAILSGTRRINLMGCLLIPTIVYYLFF